MSLIIIIRKLNKYLKYFFNKKEIYIYILNKIFESILFRWNFKENMGIIIWFFCSTIIQIFYEKSFKQLSKWWSK